MSAVSANVVAIARNEDGKNAAKTRQPKENGKSAVDDGEWFGRTARKLYPHKPGTILHLVTGLGDERLCQRYASGEVRPPAYFLRTLLRGDHGERWFNALMEGAAAPWWAEIHADAEFGRRIGNVKR